MATITTATKAPYVLVRGERIVGYAYTVAAARRRARPGTKVLPVVGGKVETTAPAAGTLAAAKAAAARPARFTTCLRTGGPVTPGACPCPRCQAAR